MRITIFLVLLSFFARAQQSSITAAAQLNNYSTSQYDQLPLLLNEDNVFFFSSHKERSMFQQISVETGVTTTGVPVTQAKFDDNKVGFIYDLGPNALKATSTSNAVPPVLDSDATKNTSFYFSGSKHLFIMNSRSICKNFHTAGETFSIFLWAKKEVNGTAMPMMANTNATSTNLGFYLATTTGNKVIFALYAGASGNPIASYTSTADFLIADSWTPIIITVSGSGATAGTMYIGDNTPESFNVDNEGSASLPTGQVTFGSRENLGTFFTGNLDCFGAQNRVLTTEEIEDFQAYNPARSTANFLTLEIEYDFDDESTMWADVAKTTPITDGTGIAQVTNKKTSNFGPRTDDLTQPTSGSRPLYQSNVTNGLGVAEYDGIDNTLPLAEITERGGAFVIFFVIKNEDLDFGSRPIASSTDSYFVITGPNYDAGSIFDSPYYVLHHEVSVSSDNPSGALSNGLDYEVFGIRRNQNITEVFTQDGTSKKTSVRQWQVSELGRDQSGTNGFWMDGNFGKFIKYNGWMTDVEMIEKLNEIKNQYN